MTPVLLDAGEALDAGLCVTCGQVFRFRLHPDGWSGAEGAVSYRSEGGQVVCSGTQSDVERLFRLGESFGGYAAKIVALDERFGTAVESLPGLRLLRPSDRVESVFSFLCTSNNHLARIEKMVGHLAGLAGGGVGFSEVERIAQCSEPELRAAGFGYRAATIPRVAAEIVGKGGRAYLDELARIGYAPARDEVRRWAGVGPKLADCICLYALGYDEAVPVDTHLWNAVTLTLWPEWRGSALTERRSRVVGDTFRDRFGVLAGYAQQLLFVWSLRGGACQLA